jgi:hypothetical protein
MKVLIEYCTSKLGMSTLGFKESLNNIWQLVDVSVNYLLRYIWSEKTQ